MPRYGSMPAAFPIEPTTPGYRRCCRRRFCINGNTALQAQAQAVRRNVQAGGCPGPRNIVMRYATPGVGISERPLGRIV
jgi:hypothetical protein